MMRLTCFGLGAALAVVLATQTTRAAEPDKLLPADSEFVLSVNVKQIVESDIIKKYALEQMKQALQGNDAQKMMKELGLDPLKDISRIVMGGSGKDKDDAKFVVVVHGKFEPETLFKAAEAQSRKDADHFSMVKDGKDTLFKYQPDNGNPVYGTVVDEKTLIFGSDKKMVTTALAASGGKGGAVSKELATLVGKMDDKASVWMVAVTKGKLDNLKLPGGGGGNPQLQGQLGKMESVSLAVRVTEDIALDVNLGMKDADAADEFGKSVEEGLTQVKGLLPFLTAQNPQLKPLVEVSKTLKSAVKDKNINITAKMRGDAIGEMLKGGKD